MKRTVATINHFQFNSQEESPMTNKLQQYFPMLRTREEILHEIEHRPNLRRTFYNWSECPTEKQPERLSCQSSL